MQYLPIILAFALCFSLIYVFKVKTKASRYITIGAMVSAILFLIPWGPLAYDGYILYIIVLIISLLVTEQQEGLNGKEKIYLYVFIVISIIPTIPIISSNKSLGYFSVIGFIPFFLFLYFIFYKTKALSDEFGYLSIFAVFSLISAISGLILILNA